jgi:hypothetical protein
MRCRMMLDATLTRAVLAVRVPTVNSARLFYPNDSKKRG